MAELTVRFDLSFGTRSLRCAMAAAMIFSAVSEVASESVTLTTYYPAPSGVYTQMIVTNNTYLSRDGGWTSIGGATVKDAELDVTYPGGSAGIVIHGGSGDTWFPFTDGKNYIRGTTVIADTGGNVGIGTNSPAQKLDVAGAESNYGMLPQYQAWAAYGTGGGGAAIYNDNTSYKALMVVGNNSKGGERMVGIWDSLTVNGSITTTDGSACAEYSYFIDDAGHPASVCPGNMYATATSGVIADLTEMPYYSESTFGAAGALSDATAPMLCCPCPLSGCPNLP